MLSIRTKDKLLLSVSIASVITGVAYRILAQQYYGNSSVSSFPFVIAILLFVFGTIALFMCLRQITHENKRNSMLWAGIYAVLTLIQSVDMYQMQSGYSSDSWSIILRSFGPAVIELFFLLTYLMLSLRKGYFYSFLASLVVIVSISLSIISFIVNWEYIDLVNIVSFLSGLFGWLIYVIGFLPCNEYVELDEEDAEKAFFQDAVEKGKQIFSRQKFPRRAKYMCVVFLIVACIFYGAIQIAGNDKEYRDAALSYSMKAYLYNSWVDTYNTIVGIGNVASQYGIGGTSYKDVAEPLAEMRRLEAEMAPLEAIIKPVVDRQNTYSWFSIGAAILSGICLLFCIVIGIMQRKKIRQIYNASLAYDSYESEPAIPTETESKVSFHFDEGSGL